MTLTMD